MTCCWDLKQRHSDVNESWSASSHLPALQTLERALVLPLFLFFPFLSSNCCFGTTWRYFFNRSIKVSVYDMKNVSNIRWLWFSPKSTVGILLSCNHSINKSIKKIIIILRNLCFRQMWQVSSIFLSNKISSKQNQQSRLMCHQATHRLKAATTTFFLATIQGGLKETSKKHPFFSIPIHDLMTMLTGWWHHKNVHSPEPFASDILKLWCPRQQTGKSFTFKFILYS